MFCCFLSSKGRIMDKPDVSCFQHWDRVGGGLYPGRCPGLGCWVPPARLPCQYDSFLGLKRYKTVWEDARLVRKNIQHILISPEGTQHLSLAQSARNPCKDGTGGYEESARTGTVNVLWFFVSRRGKNCWK